MAKVVRKKNQAAYDRLRKVSAALTNTELKVGWFESNRYPNGTPVAYIATINEFGSPSRNIPARPFMRPTVIRGRDFWKEFVMQETKKAYNGRQTVSGMFNALGLNVSGEIGRSISEVFEPPLSPVTIRARLRKLENQVTIGNLYKPLVETGLMFTSVTYVVEE